MSSSTVDPRQRLRSQSHGRREPVGASLPLGCTGSTHGPCSKLYDRVGKLIDIAPRPTCSCTPAGHRRPRRPDHQPPRAPHRPEMERTGGEARTTNMPTDQLRPETLATPHTPSSSVDPGLCPAQADRGARLRPGRHPARQTRPATRPGQRPWRVATARRLPQSAQTPRTARNSRMRKAPISYLRAPNVALRTPKRHSARHRPSPYPRRRHQPPEPPLSHSDPGPVDLSSMVLSDPRS